MTLPSMKPNRLEQIDTNYQLIIIGGGIYGAALCWEASHRGIKTLLIEKEDYASGASSNSLKTIHGGLRSLQSFNLKAVIKGIRERSIFLHIAPNYVKPLPCVLPTTKSLMKSRMVVGAGLLLYNIICQIISKRTAKTISLPHAKLLSLNEINKRTKNLFNDDKFTGGALWYDAQVLNTERFVLQFIKSAQLKGAVTLNHLKAIKTDHDETINRHKVLIQDQLTGQEKDVFSSAIVDCTSAWNFIKSAHTFDNQNEDISFIKAVNIIIKKKLFENAAGINVQSTKSLTNRLFFFAPWRNQTLIGTWYSKVDPYPDISFSKSEAKQFIAEINSAFEQPLIELDDICNVHIGFLPASQPDKLPDPAPENKLLKNYELKDWSNKFNTKHLYSLRGTKYTLARHDAEKVIDDLSSKMNWDISKSRSSKTPIFQAAQFPEKTYAIPENIIYRLMNDYGVDLEKVLSFIERFPDSSEIIPGTKDHISAEIYYAIHHEQALSLTDLLKRRFNIGDKSPPEQNTTQYCANLMQQLMSWSTVEKDKQISDLYLSYPEYLSNLE